MKRLAIIIAALVMLIGCEKHSTIKTYTFIDNFGVFEGLVEELGGDVEVGVEVIFKEYNSDDLPVKYESVKNPRQGIPFSFVASEDATYLTVRISVTGTYENGESLTISKYIAVVYLLKNDNTKIVFDENTYYQSSEPKR